METNLAVATLGALAQETRLAIYQLLVEAGRSGLPAGSIAARLDVAAPTLSFHLKELAYAGLVTSESRGRFLVYRADYGTMNALLDFLTANCCRGSDCAGDPSVVCVPIANPASRRTPTEPRAAKSGDTDEALPRTRPKALGTRNAPRAAVERTNRLKEIP